MYGGDQVSVIEVFPSTAHRFPGASKMPVYYREHVYTFHSKCKYYNNGSSLIIRHNISKLMQTLNLIAANVVKDDYQITSMLNI